MRRPRGLLVVLVAGLALLLVAAGIGAAAVRNTPAPHPIDVAGFAKRANLIFKGTVTKVEYKEAETVPLLDDSGAAVLDRSGQPVLVDGSGLPHTFVTFRVEKTYKGTVSGGEFTLRFLGGQSSRTMPGSSTPLVLQGEDIPLFDVGDRDVLFVEGNNDKICPLTACEAGRFRLISTGGDPLVFADRGHEILNLTGRASGATAPGGNFAVLGPPQHLPEFTKNVIGNDDYERVQGPDAEDPGVTPEPALRLGRQFTESAFDQYLTVVVRRVHTQRELNSLPPAPTADIRQPIFPDPMTDAAPVIYPEERSETAVAGDDEFMDRSPEERARLIEADRQEREAFAANGGNPVLPGKAG